MSPHKKGAAAVKHFSKPAYNNASDICFGKSLSPVSTRRGVTIGNGKVIPELNFTVPQMRTDLDALPKLKSTYREIVQAACTRATELECNELVIEFETLPDMTETPRIASEITSTVNEVLESFYAQKGLKTALRITPNDLREMVRPPVMRSGSYWESTLNSFKMCADAGADLLAIESTGGKEVHDQAIVACDIGQIFFSLITLGCRDMEYLWTKIVDIANQTDTIASGDTACGFGNTAMVLAEKKYIPKSFAAVVRTLSAVRSLVAYEVGAQGPGKDCGYENVYLKAITGMPMSMEGKTAACAHSSPVGNVAAAMCDLWSNESVQNVKLLGGMAPQVSLEQLIYDCRLMNTSIEKGAELHLRDMLVDSDAPLDPQAYVLTPETTVAIARTITEADNYYDAGKSVIMKTVELLKKGNNAGHVRIPEMELFWLDSMEETVAAFPDSEEAFIESILPQIDTTKCNVKEYGIDI